MANLFLITARGGSKGVPGKNLRKIGGRSLIEWKARSVSPAIKYGDLVMCSTEDAAIADEAQWLGIPVIDRPKELATDTAASADVIRHALGVVEPNFDTVVLLEPSAPFTQTEHFIAALEMKKAKNAHLIVGMKHTDPHTTFIGEQPDDDCVTPIVVKMDRVGRNLRRQDLKQEWTMNGALYVFDTETFLSTGSIYGGARNYGILMDRWHSIEIDSMHDFEMAKYACDRGYVT